MLTIYDLLRRSRILGIFAICGGAAPFAVCLLFAYFVLGHGFWDELTSKSSSGNHPYFFWVWFMLGGAVWCGIASAVMHSIKLGMTPEQIEKVECL